MFDFTTTNVINSNQDYTTGKPRWSMQAADGDKPASLNIKGVNNFISTNVKSIYKAEAHDAEMAKVTVDLSQLNGKKGDQFRVVLYIGITQASADSRFANDLKYKGRPVTVEFLWLDSAAATAAKLVKTIRKYAAMIYDGKIFSVSNSSTYVTFEAVEEYERFIALSLEKFDKDAWHKTGEYTQVRTLEDIPVKNSNAEVGAAAEGFFAGKEGFGTYSFLLHNLRLPTYERNRAFAPYQGDAPVPGAKYNQYTIYYCVNRGVLGLNAVGDVVTSITTHVFYVRTDLAADFENALASLGEITNVQTKAEAGSDSGSGSSTGGSGDSGSGSGSGDSGSGSGSGSSSSSDTPVITSADPDSIQKVNATKTISLTGTNLDKLTKDSFTVSGDGITVDSYSASSATSASLVVTTKSGDVGGSVMYNGKEIVNVFAFQG